MECRIISYIQNTIQYGIIKINENWLIDHTITKLETPYYLITGSIEKIKEPNTIDYMINEAKKKFVNYSFDKLNWNNIYQNTAPGYSGSPWIIDNKTNYLHLGTHIGRTIGIKIDTNNNVIAISYIAYVKPIENYQKNGEI